MGKQFHFPRQGISSQLLDLIPPPHKMTSSLVQSKVMYQHQSGAVSSWKDTEVLQLQITHFNLSTAWGIDLFPASSN